MSEPTLTDQQRQLLHAFRQAVSQRIEAEKAADDRLRSEQRQADQELARIKQEAEQQRTQAEAAANERYQTGIATAAAELARVRRKTQEKLQHTEAEVASGYSQGRQTADEAMAEVQRQTEERLNTQEADINAALEARRGEIETEWQKRRAEATDLLKNTERTIRYPAFSLGTVNLGHLLPERAPNRDIILDERERLDPARALAESGEAANEAARAVERAANELGRWRVKRNRYITAVAVAVVVVVLFAMHMYTQWYNEQQRQAQIAFEAFMAPTWTAEVQARQTAEAQARQTAEAQARQTTEMQARQTAEVQARQTAEAYSYLSLPTISSISASQVVRYSELVLSSYWLSDIVFSPNGELLAVSTFNAWGSDNSVVILNARNFTLIGELHHSGPITAIDFSSDSSKILSGGCTTPLSLDATCPEGRISIWDVSNRMEEWRYIVGPGEVSRVAYSPDGMGFVTGHGDGEVKFWNAFTYEVVYSYKPHNNTITGIAYSHDGQLFVTSGLDEKIILWDIQNDDIHLMLDRKVVLDRKANSGRVQFSSNDEYIAAVGGGNDLPTLMVWRRDGTMAYKTFDHIWSAGSLAFGPDASLLATGGGHLDKTIKLRKTETGEVLAILTGHTEWVAALAFSPDGRFLASAGGDGKLLIWAAQNQ